VVRQPFSFGCPACFESDFKEVLLFQRRHAQVSLPLLSTSKKDKYSISAGACGGKNWKNQMGHQKLKGLIQSERHFAIFGRNGRAPSEPNASVASQIKCLRLAPNHWALATTQHPKGRKIMTSKRRKLPNRRSCSLFQIEGYERLLASETRLTLSIRLTTLRTPIQETF
jgi:hypothetical protein